MNFDNIFFEQTKLFLLFLLQLFKRNKTNKPRNRRPRNTFTNGFNEYLFQVNTEYSNLIPYNGSIKFASMLRNLINRQMKKMEKRKKENTKNKQTNKKQPTKHSKNKNKNKQTKEKTLSIKKQEE